MAKNEDLLYITVHPHSLVIPNSIQAEFQFHYDGKVGVDEILVAAEAGFLIFTSLTLPNTPSELVLRLFRFIESYQNGICILQHFPEILDQRSSKLMDTLVYLASENRLSVIPTRSAIDTALCVRSWAKRMQLRDRPPKIARKKGKHHTILDAQKEFLQGLINCGPTKVDALVEKFESPLNLFQEIERAELVYTSTGRVKKIEGKFGELEGFGPEFIIQNKRLFEKNTIEGHD